MFVCVVRYSVNVTYLLFAFIPLKLFLSRLLTGCGLVIYKVKTRPGRIAENAYTPRRPFINLKINYLLAVSYIFLSG